MNPSKLWLALAYVLAAPFLLLGVAWRYWSRDRHFLAALRRGTVRCADCRAATDLRTVSACPACHYAEASLVWCSRCRRAYAVTCRCGRTLEVR